MYEADEQGWHIVFIFLTIFLQRNKFFSVNVQFVHYLRDKNQLEIYFIPVVCRHPPWQAGPTQRLPPPRHAHNYKTQGVRPAQQNYRTLFKPFLQSDQPSRP